MSDYINAEAAERTGEAISFSFGANWRKFLDHLTDQQIQEAKLSLTASFGGASIEGTSFLDLGCGSGLFSLAAAHLGANRIFSTDVDPSALACAQELRRRFDGGTSWQVLQGSVLDSSFMTTLPKADRLYSWGVLHHTGAMWMAVDQAVSCIAPGGLACIALYNRPRRPRLHLTLKRAYNRAPAPVRPVMRGMWALAQVMVNGRRHPIRYVRHYGTQNGRGMDFWRDVEDWLGGLPWEYAQPQEVHDAVTERGLRLVNSLVLGPGCCNEYLIQRDA